ncbi:hypothetical protein SUGI_1161340 [Cryptomeria japonica]|uniref:exosome complex component RRP45A n=1 Tax=Cryptomeria japonica TaxID=3369 RepID=UPI0024148385|nr:exosome complex component RRP45A [Cryptomeria japonica]GLJ54182.1 hypothetical protein SUGI_1161340 [Cryptomeria japonica]
MMANTLRLSVNEKKFILEALQLEQRIDGRRPFDFRRVSIKFGREDGAAEVQLGQTHVMGIVTGQVLRPYRDRPNEGTLSVFTEFSPMADPTFEVGRPGEFAVELGRIVDRGLRESRAIDTESLCILAGKAVWGLRVDLNILDNGGNLVDAANIAALAALLSFRRPECSVGGQDGQEITIHPPEIREPLPLIIHHLPIAVTFAFFGEGDMVVLDPNYKEEAVMGGRMTITMNTHGDVCAVQKGGGVGVSQSEIMRCFRVASTKAADITAKLKECVEAHSVERAQRKIKRHRPQVAATTNGSEIKMSEETLNTTQKQVDNAMEIEKILNESNGKDEIDMEVEEGEVECDVAVEVHNIHDKKEMAGFFSGGPSKWDPYSRGISAPLSMELLQSSLGTELLDAVQGNSLQKTSQSTEDLKATISGVEQTAVVLEEQDKISPGLVSLKATDIQSNEQVIKISANEPQSLQDAIKDNSRRKKKKKAAKS